VGGANLVVFVGRRIDVHQIADPGESGSLDLRFAARFEVLDVIFGFISKGEVNFTAYDHYGEPAFARHQFALLYVSKASDGTFFHQKYLSQPVFPTINGGWASCGDPYAGKLRRGSVRAVPINFSPSVTADLSGLSAEEIDQQFPLEYFDRRGDIAVCKAGVFVDTLFEIQREGALKERGVLR